MSLGTSARPSSDAIGDALVSALSLEDLAVGIDTDVVLALARWRDVDPLSLHDLRTALVTRSGDAAINHAGYLVALHGFVAESITYETLTPHHSVVFPHQTTVPAYDLIVDGEPMQIKEGVSAKEAVRNALQRYPHVTHFATDPKAAAELKALGIDALGIPGLEPDRIARETRDSLHGLDALEHAGDVHVPILSTVFSLCRYWERFDRGCIDARTAVLYGAVDIGAQAVGSAMGLKMAAIAVVATGGFAVAGVPLTTGAIVGALGLRHLVNTQRMSKLRAALAELDVLRRSAEEATRIVIELSSYYIRGEIRRTDRALKAALAAIEARWQEVRKRFDAEEVSELESLCVAAVRGTDRPLRDALERRLARTRSIAEARERLGALRRLLRLAIRATPTASVELARHLHLARRRAHERTTFLQELCTRSNAEADRSIAAAKRDLQVAVTAEYAVLFERLGQLSSRVATSLDGVRREAERVGANWERLSA